MLHYSTYTRVPGSVSIQKIRSVPYGYGELLALLVYLTRRRAAVRSLVVALLSAVRFRQLLATFADKLSSTASTAANAAAAGPPDHHNRHRHRRGRTHCRTLAKKAR